MCCVSGRGRLRHAGLARYVPDQCVRLPAELLDHIELRLKATEDL
jgi:hypothetical protein